MHHDTCYIMLHLMLHQITVRHLEIAEPHGTNAEPQGTARNPTEPHGTDVEPHGTTQNHTEPNFYRIYGDITHVMANVIQKYNSQVRNKYVK